MSQFSLYTLEEELKRGYITIAGGHRVGLAGKVILEKGVVKAIRDISSFNIRIARQKIGVAEIFIPNLYNGRRGNIRLSLAPLKQEKRLFYEILQGLFPLECDHLTFLLKK